MHSTGRVGGRPFQYHTDKHRDCAFWFGMEFTVDALEEAPATASWKVPVPMSDADRRVHELMMARDGAVFHGVHPPGRPSRVAEFFYAAFYVTLGNKLPPNPLLGQAIPFSSNASTRGRGHLVSLAGHSGKILVFISRHAGVLPSGALFTFNCLRRR